MSGQEAGLVGRLIAKRDACAMTGNARFWLLAIAEELEGAERP